jgi:ribosomal protein L31E
VSFKKRAPRAIKEIKAFAEKAMVCAYFFTAVVRTGVVLRWWSEGKASYLPPTGFTYRLCMTLC